MSRLNRFDSICWCLCICCCCCSYCCCDKFWLNWWSFISTGPIDDSDSILTPVEAIAPFRVELIFVYFERINSGFRRHPECLLNKQLNLHKIKAIEMWYRRSPWTGRMASHFVWPQVLMMICEKVFIQQSRGTWPEILPFKINLFVYCLFLRYEIALCSHHINDRFILPVNWFGMHPSNKVPTTDLIIYWLESREIFRFCISKNWKARQWWIKLKYFVKTILRFYKSAHWPNEKNRTFFCDERVHHDSWSHDIFYVLVISRLWIYEVFIIVCRNSESMSFS